MKRYLVFVTFDYSCEGGLKNLYSEADTLQEAISLFYHNEEAHPDSISYKVPANEFGIDYEEADEVHILDIQTGQKYFARGYSQLVGLTEN